MAKKITTEDLAAMTERGLLDVKKRLGDKIEAGFRGMTEDIHLVVDEVRGVREEVRVWRQASSLDYAEVSQRIQKLEQEMAAFKASH